MIAVAVGLLSAAVVACEILLVRLFAIEQFHHVAYMAIGVAMLGFGASGTLLALVRPREGAALRWFPACAAAAAVAFAVAPWLVERVALDATRLAWDARQWAMLGLVYLLLALPFGFSGAAILLALTGAGQRPGLVYGASFGGAALGAAGALAASAALAPAQSVALPALLAAAGPLVARRSAVPIATGLVVGALAVMVPWRLAIHPSKALPQVAAFPEAERLYQSPGTAGWVVAVRAPAFRFAPGLSLAYRGAFPRQDALFVDADLAGAVTDWSDSAAARILAWVPAALPFALGDPPRHVLVIGNAAGLDVPAALALGAARVTAVDLHPRLVRAARAPRFERGRVRWIVGDARAHVARTAERYDRIAIGPAGGPGAGSGGLHALQEDFLHTVDAYAAYLTRLTDGGVLAITRWLELPPRSSVRVVLTAAAALRRRGTAPERSLVVARSWGTVTVLVKPAGFAAAELAALEAWAASRWYDLDWRPGTTAPVSRFNLLDDPVLFTAARAAVTSEAAAREFAAGYPFRVAPATDARPYPHQFVGPVAWRAFAGRSRGDWVPFAEWDYVGLVATLAQSALLGAALIVAPVVVTHARRRLRGAERGGARLVVYFVAIGLAYLAAEMAAIQQLTLLLGHPVYAVTAVLGVMLACSGLGSVWSDRLAADVAAPVCLVIALLAALLAIALLPTVHAVQAAPLAVRAVVAVVVLAPVATLMGAPFPLGLRALAGGAGPRAAWAWAANGAASAVAAPLAALVALEAGSQLLLGGAAASYAVAAAAARRYRAA